MRVVPIPCLKDNYAYVILCEEKNTFAVVDPSESEPVLRATLPLSSRGARPSAILSTHHHWDHVGGNEELASTWRVPVYGSVHDRDEARLPALTDAVRQGATFHVGEVEVHVIEVPGHTLGAVAYLCRSKAGPSCVFTGDTMFVAGAGRLFEGTATMMHTSLKALGALAPETEVFCGHEYTEANLRFAQTLEPENADIGARMEWARARREKGEPTVPSTIADELRTNPFLRVEAPALRATLGMSAEIAGDEVLARVRARKDAFKG